MSRADNLVPGDTNRWDDIFVHDRQTRQTTRVSVASDGQQSNSLSFDPSLSADGRYVAFSSSADNLAPGDTNGTFDIFVHDRQTHQTTRISVTSGGNEGDSDSSAPSISADGRYVAFMSWADNLVPGDTNDAHDIFVHDRQTHQTSRISVASDGRQADSVSFSPSISADGRHVAFGSIASNLVPGDTNDTWDIFVHDRQTHETTRISVASGGNEGDSGSATPSISADGRYVAFLSQADNLVPGDTNNMYDIFVRDRLLLGGRQADLALSQSGPAAPVHLGEPLSYSVTVTNRGRGPAYYVNLTDLVPQNARLLSVKPSYGLCSRAAVSVCRLGTLAVGARTTVKVSLTATQTGEVSNRVSVKAAPRDPNPADNASEVKVMVVP